jgi:hypothetical protein
VEIMRDRDSQFLRSQAELCIALSRATFDLTVAGRLRAMAGDLRAKAEEWEDGVNFHPPGNGHGANAGRAGGR